MTILTLTSPEDTENQNNFQIDLKKNESWCWKYKLVINIKKVNLWASAEMYKKQKPQISMLGEVLEEVSL